MLYQIVFNLLMPPVGFLTLALLLWLLLWLARSAVWRRRALMLQGAALLLLFAAALPVVPAMLRLGLEAGLDLNPPTDGADKPLAIIVLGGDEAVNDLHGGLLEGIQPGNLSIGRLHAAEMLAGRTGLPILITGGGMGAGPTVSALMQHVLEKEGPIKVRWLETQAGNTWQNADYSTKMLREAGINSAYVVTDGWHMRRAIIAFRHTGLRVWPAPVSLTHKPTPLLIDFVPRAGIWHETYYALHEWIGCAFYALYD